MSDLIDRQAAIDMFNRLADDPWNANANTTWSKAYGYAAEMIEEMPSAQPDYDLSGYSDRLWQAAYERGKAEAEQRWIPVTERLPEIDMTYPHHDDYLVQYDSGGMDVASWSNVNMFWTNHVTEPYWNCAQFQTVVAWMPLPEPYRKETGDD